MITNLHILKTVILTKPTKIGAYILMTPQYSISDISKKFF